MTPRPAADRTPTFLEPLETRALLASIGGIALHPHPGLMHEFHERLFHTMSRPSEGEYANAAPDQTAHSDYSDAGSMRVTGVVVRHVEVLVLTIRSVAPAPAPPVDQPMPRDHGDHHTVHRAPPPQSDYAAAVPQPATPQTPTDVVRATASVATSTASQQLIAPTPKVTFIAADDARAAELVTDASSYVVRTTAASMAESNFTAAAAIFRSTFGGGTTQALSLQAELPRVALAAAGRVLSAAKEQLTAEAAHLAGSFLTGTAQIERDFHFERLGNPMLMVGDAIAAFADENAIVGQTARALGVATTGHAKAWAVTAAVVCADAAILLHWRRNRKRAAVVTVTFP